MVLASRSELGAERALKKVANRPWFHKLARLGYATKGAVYFFMGTLALDAALTGRRPEGDTGVVRHIHDLPLGSVLLPLTAFGLSVYALWRAVQAVFDTDGEGKRAAAVLKRIGHMIAAILYGSLSVLACQLWLGHRTSRGDAVKTWLGELLAQPAGEWFAFAIGIGFVIFAATQLFSAFTGRFARYLDHFRMNSRQRHRAIALGRLGLGARAVVLATMGLLITKATWDSRPSQASGMEGALAHLQREPYGPLLLAGIAIGLICYGLFMIECARFRRLGRA
jgi:hypothetical protein